MVPAWVGWEWRWSFRILFRGAGEAVLRQGRSLGHDARGPRDRVGEVKVGNRRRERRRAEFAGAADAGDHRAVGRRDDIDLGEMGMRARERGAQLALRIERQLRADRLGKRAQDRPVFSGVAGREYRALCELWSAFQVDMSSRLFGIG